MADDNFSVPGFTAAGAKGFIRGKDRLDVGLIFSEVGADAAGVFTRSLVKAAPVVLGMEKIRKGRVQAILVNSGIANACTGEQGMRTARASARLVAESLQLSEEFVQVSSTGVIGQQLEIGCIETAMQSLVGNLSPLGLDDVARAMMTTDTFPKKAITKGNIDGCEITLAGLAKGAGMIMPDMATMLSYVMTDAHIPSGLLQTMLKRAVDVSFNAITIDGDTSTNDTVLLLANGRAGNPPLEAGSESAKIFQAMLDELLKDLALQIVTDGEGATKLITVRVTGARNDVEARLAAKTVANSALVKTAFFGEDANWGRIIGALGRSGAHFSPDQVDIGFDDVLLVENGLGLSEETELRATEVLKQKEFTVNINLNAGPAVMEVYTCDLSLDYVKINADYRT